MMPPPSNKALRFHLHAQWTPAGTAALVPDWAFPKDFCQRLGCEDQMWADSWLGSEPARVQNMGSAVPSIMMWGMGGGAWHCPGSSSSRTKHRGWTSSTKGRGQRALLFLGKGHSFPHCLDILKAYSRCMKGLKTSSTQPNECMICVSKSLVLIEPLIVT